MTRPVFTNSTRRSFAVGMFCTLAMTSSLSAISPVELVLETGKAIFEHRWSAGQPASPGGDGLGPLHNDVSCVACHNQGGVGGGGAIEKNVSLLSLSPRPDGMSRRVFHESVLQAHPGFAKDPLTLNTNLVLHKFSIDAAYQGSRLRLVGSDVPLQVAEDASSVAERMVADQPVRLIPHASGVKFRLSQRNSPALFGIGLIDRVPDSLLIKLAAAQAADGVVSGRAAPVNGRVGRFGWKGQTARLHEFVRDACANELGLQVPGQEQAMHPLNVDYKPDGLDLNAIQLESLTAFVALLPRPRAATPDDARLAEHAHRGRAVFAGVGCAHCHVETLGSSSSGVQGIFSDLLLHDMGPTLADPVLANAQTMTMRVSTSPTTPTTPTAPSSSSGGSYGGGGSEPVARRGSGTRTISRIVPTNRDQEWRTPPLWGVRDSAPYLHDGRASTLTEAILYHGGEAKPMVARFLKLKPSDRMALLEFLNTLTAPAGGEA